MVRHAACWLSCCIVLQVIRGSHVTGRVLPHYCCWRDTDMVEINEQEIEEILGTSEHLQVVHTAIAG